MEKTYILGVRMSHFGHVPDLSLADIAGEASAGAMAV
jgi:hypothetical protein